MLASRFFLPYYDRSRAGAAAHECFIILHALHKSSPAQEARTGKERQQEQAMKNKRFLDGGAMEIFGTVNVIRFSGGLGELT